MQLASAMPFLQRGDRCQSWFHIGYANNTPSEPLQVFKRGSPLYTGANCSDDRPVIYGVSKIYICSSVYRHARDRHDFLQYLIVNLGAFNLTSTNLRVVAIRLSWQNQGVSFHNAAPQHCQSDSRTAIATHTSQPQSGPLLSALPQPTYSQPSLNVDPKNPSESKTAAGRRWTGCIPDLQL